MRAKWLNHSFAPHMHSSYAVGMNFAGHGAFDCRGQVQDAAPGTCNLIAPGELHTGRAVCDRGWIYRNVYVEAAAMHGLLESVECSVTDPGFRLPLLHDPVLGECLRDLFSGIERNASLLETESRLLCVIARLVAHHFAPRRNIMPGAGKEHRAVRQIRQWLRANPAENVSVNALAKMAGVSAYYLVRVFHSQVGVPPHAYQMLARVDHARALLRSGLSIADSAHQAGFYDQSHLNRCFKKVLGLTPGEYSGRRQRDSGSEARHC